MDFIDEARKEIFEAMENDLNVSKAFAAFRSCMKKTANIISENQKLITKSKKLTEDFNKVFAVVDENK